MRCPRTLRWMWLRPRMSAVALLALVATACGPVVTLESTDPVGSVRQPQTSQVLAADGSLLAALHAEENRRDVALAEVPADLVAAVVAIEDRRFFLHRGVDVPAIARAAVRNVEAGEITEGGSTITQQYVKNTILGPVRTFDRKVKEAVLAYQLEQRYTKTEILERYLNTIYFGHGAYGVAAAAERFFDRNVSRLELPQSALLAGLIASPSTFDPFRDPDAALRRRDTVLSAMAAATGEITAAEADEASRAPLGLGPPPAPARFVAPYAVEQVRRQIADDPEGRFEVLGATRDERLASLFTGGLRIATTIDLVDQSHAEEAIPAILTEEGDPAAALVALEPDTGAIRALVGGRDFYDESDPTARFDLAVQGRRQPGSAFKPIVLATALSRGVSLDEVFPGGVTAEIDDPRCRGPEGPWRPSNYGRASYGPLTLREATVRSVNTVYARLVSEVGPTAVVATAHSLGIGGELDPLCAVGLGAEEVSPLDLASAYASFATLGRRHPPYLVERITTADGEVLYEHGDESHRVLDESVAYLVTQTLGEVVRRGTGVRASIGRPQAGKTGTTDDHSDAWYVGYTPDLVAAVWVGYPEGRIPMVPPTTRITVEGGRWPAEVWATFASAALADTPARDFAVPEIELVRVEVDVSRNCLPTPYTPGELVQVREYLRGTEPTERCTEPTGPTVDEPVPQLVGYTREIAVRLLSEKGFVLDERPFASPLYPPGYVAGQRPAAGGVPEDGTVVLWVSVNSRERAAVPDVVGLDVDTATETLEAAGWVVVVDRRCPEESRETQEGQQGQQGQEGQQGQQGDGCPGLRSSEVWDQTPAPDERVKLHSLVTLRVAP
ncbi:MAG: PBP1A family penicillin-binding protein [Nitriliruptorales bacterium]